MDIRVLDIIEETTVDGPGFRTSIYCAGCQHHCPGCHNPQSWDMDGGNLFSVHELAEKILSDPFSDVTFTGGDPFFQASAFAELASTIKERSNKTIWCYTGYTIESLLSKPTDCSERTLLQLIDVLVDGPFILAQRDEDLLFRGSSNQRIIDVPATLSKGSVVLWTR